MHQRHRDARLLVALEASIDKYRTAPTLPAPEMLRLLARSSHLCEAAGDRCPSCVIVRVKGSKYSGCGHTPYDPHPMRHRSPETPLCMLPIDELVALAQYAEDEVRDELIEHLRDRCVQAQQFLTDLLPGLRAEVFVYPPPGGEFPQMSAIYRARTPDPGVCRVRSIDLDGQRAFITNGSCSYSPSFDEILIYPSPTP